jgi:organic hydroperoxide reductase OsmC/OhrA
MSAFLAIAENSKLEIVTFLSKARGKLEKIEGSGYQITEILLKPELVIRGAKDLDRAERILQKAEKNCFISNSIKTVVKLEPEIHQE